MHTFPAQFSRLFRLDALSFSICKNLDFHLLIYLFVNENQG